MRSGSRLPAARSVAVRLLARSWRCTFGRAPAERAPCSAPPEPSEANRFASQGRPLVGHPPALSLGACARSSRDEDGVVWLQGRREESLRSRSGATWRVAAREPAAPISSRRAAGIGSSAAVAVGRGAGGVGRCAGGRRRSRLVGQGLRAGFRAARRQPVRHFCHALSNNRLHLTARGFGLAVAVAGGWVGALRRRCSFAAGRRAV